jgi:hypothetical protein
MTDYVEGKLAEYTSFAPRGWSAGTILGYDDDTPANDSGRLVWVRAVGGGKPMPVREAQLRRPDVVGVNGNVLPEGERAAFSGLVFDGRTPIPPGTEVAASAVQERMFAVGWSGTAGHELGRLARRGLARRVQPGVWVALAAWADR